MRQYERRKKEIACKRKWKTTNCNCEYSSETAPLFHGIWLTVPLATAHHFALCLSKFDFYLPISLRIPDQYLHGSRISFAFFILFRSQPSPNRLMLGKHFSLYTFSGQRIRKKCNTYVTTNWLENLIIECFRGKKIVKIIGRPFPLSLSLSLSIWHTRNNVFVFSRLDVRELCDRQISINALRISSSRCINWFDVSIG